MNHWPSAPPKREPLKPPSVEAAKADTNDPGALAVMRSPKFFMTTCFMCLAHFTKDFSVFGLAYVFPQYFQSSGHGTVASHLIIVALLAIPGVALAALGMLEISPEALAVPCAYALKFLSLVFFII